MYLNILKKDLKRKKTMNCIILLFVILSTLFFTSSVNNILSVIGGLDRYLNMAGMAEEVAMITEPDSGEPFAELLRKSDKVSSFKRENVLVFTPEKISCKDNEVTDMPQMMLSSVDTMKVNCYDIDNEPITEVAEGSVLLTSFAAKRLNAEAGDIIHIKVGGESLSLKMAGICKDAVLGSQMVSCPRFILNHSDFTRFYEIDSIRESFRAGMYLVNADSQEIADLVSNVSGCQFHCSRATIKLSYMPDMMIAAIVMVVSLFLILISFVVLRFTIGFSIQEEFREIGVMKAIGIRSCSVRMLYLVKYFGIAVIGALIGFAASFPFGRLLMNSVSRSMVLGNDSPVLCSVICMVLIIAVVVLFCWCCTAKIKKLTPIDAVRSGQTGERFHKHGSLSLGKSRLGTSGFLSLNNVISAPKQSAILVVVFTLCAALTMVLSNMAATFCSEKMMPVCGLTASDLYLVSKSYGEPILKGSKTIDETMVEIEQKLADHGMQASVFAEGTYNCSAAFGNQTAAVRFLHCSDTKTTDYFYNEGTAPQYCNEIALAYPVAEALSAGIGDTVHITMSGKEGDYIITALYDTLNNLGMAGRFYEQEELPISALQFIAEYQIDFDDQPDAETLESRKAQLKTIFETDEVFNTAEYVDNGIGTRELLSGVKTLTLIISLIIIVLMTVLLERSFISKERTEIALMKAVGFRNRSVIGIHILRFLLIAAVSVVTAAAVSTPGTKLVMKPIYMMLGTSKTIITGIDPLNNYVIVPITVLAVVVFSAAMTALYTGSVKASDTAAIE